jgi:hypothetical protein
MSDCLPRATFETWLRVVNLYLVHWTGRELADLPVFPWETAYALGWGSNRTATLYTAWLGEIQALSLPAPSVRWGEAVAYRGGAARAEHGSTWCTFCPLAEEKSK